MFPLKPAVDVALAKAEGGDREQRARRAPRRERRRAGPTAATSGGTRRSPAASTEHEAQAFPAENPLFILYTSGTTGKPKGILHTSGGYLTQAAFTNKVVHDIHPETDVFWCTADIGWVTGHTYVIYGPLANGATQVLYEGTPDTPHPGRWWEIVEKYGVTILYTAPTAIRSFMKLGRADPARSSTCARCACSARWASRSTPRRGCGTGKSSAAARSPIVDTWWQTETGAIMISALPGVTDTKPGSAQVPLPGISIDVVDDDGTHVDGKGGGLLVVTEPWPTMLRGIWGDPERFMETYWEKFGDKYFAGDGARRDEDGDIWLLGRVDDVMNVSGHRLSTTEIESALVANPWTAEAAVVGASDETTGQAVVAFVIIKASQVEHATDPAGCRRGAASVGRRADRRDRAPARRLHRRRAAEDPLGQDHAPPAARCRRGPRGRRHHDARRHLGDERDQRAGQVAHERRMPRPGAIPPRHPPSSRAVVRG